MKSATVVALLLTEARFARVYRGAAPTIATWSDPARALTPEAVGEAVGPAAKRDASLLIGLPSSWCFAAQVPVDDETEPAERLYALERKLPLSAEQMAVDFVHASGWALGVACDAERVGPLVETVEALGWRVDALVPTVLLAQSAATRRRPSELAVWADDRRVDILAMESGRLTAWRLSPRQPTPVRRAVESVKTNGCREAPLVVMQDDEEVHDWLKLDAALVIDMGDVLVAAARGALKVQAGERPPVNLRRAALRPKDPLRAVRRPLRALVVASMVLMVTVGAALHAQAWRHRAAEEALRQDLESIYRDVHPDGPLPQTIARALAIEASRVREGGDRSPRTSAAITLARFYAALPEGGNLRVERIAVDNGEIELAGSVASQADATAILGHLGSQRGLNLQPPQLTVREDGRVELVISADVGQPPSQGEAR